MEGEHADVVHRPDAKAHARRAAHQPGEAHHSACRGGTSRQVERRVGCERRREQGERHHPGVVSAVHVLICSWRAAKVRGRPRITAAVPS